MLAARASGTVAPTGGEPRRSAVLFVGGRARSASLAVDRTLIDNYEAPLLELGIRVVLDGVDVTDSVVGEIELADSVDSPMRTGSLALYGKPYLPHLNWSTWTRVPIQIYVRLGRPGLSAERLELDGLIDTADPSGLVTRVTFADKALLWVSARPCFSVDPLAGHTRGEILRRVAEMSGALFESPGGAVYTKPVEVTGANLLPWMVEFGEPEGWRIRVRNDGTIETYRADLTRAPLPPAAVWTDNDTFEMPPVRPPSEVPTRVIVRGTGAVVVDELGIETTTEVDERREVMAPELAVARQNSDGSLTPLSNTTTFQERVRTRTTRTQAKRGDRLVREVLTDEGWYNPRHALLVTGSVAGLGGGPAEEGYYYATTYIDSQNQAVLWDRQRFVVLRRVETDYEYDANGTLLSQRSKTFAWYSRRAAVRSAASEGPSVAGVCIGDDGASYMPLNGIGGTEVFGLYHQADALYEYAATSGAATRQRLQEYTWHAPRAALDPTSPNFVNADGYGMANAFANWHQIRETDRQTALDAAGRVSLEVDAVTEYWAPLGPRGLWDWGQNEKGPWVAERYRYHYSNRKTFRLVSSTAYEVSTTERDQTRPPELHQGAPPVPPYLGSPWRSLAQPPLEVLFDDPAMKELFGENIVVIANPYVESQEECRNMALRMLARDLSHEVQIRRRLSWVRPGDTVFLDDPTSGFAGRLLIVARRQQLSLNPPRAVAEYVGRCPLIEGVGVA